MFVKYFSTHFSFWHFFRHVFFLPKLGHIYLIASKCLWMGTLTGRLVASKKSVKRFLSIILVWATLTCLLDTYLGSFDFFTSSWDEEREEESAVKEFNIASWLTKPLLAFLSFFLQHWVGFQKLRRSKLSTLPILVLVWIWFQAPSMQQRVPCVSWETEQVAWIICHLYLLLSLMAFRAPHSQCTARFCGSRPHPCC